MLTGAKKYHPTATSARSMLVRTRESFLGRFFTVRGHCVCRTTALGRARDSSRPPLRSAQSCCLRAAVVGQVALGTRAGDRERERRGGAGRLAAALVVARVEVAGHDSVAASVDGPGRRAGHLRAGGVVEHTGER